MVIKKFLFSEVTDLGIELTLKKKKKKKLKPRLPFLSDHMVGTDFMILCSLWYCSPHSGDIATADSFRRLSDVLEA